MAKIRCQPSPVCPRSPPLVTLVTPYSEHPSQLFGCIFMLIVIEDLFASNGMDKSNTAFSMERGGIPGSRTLTGMIGHW